MSRYKNHMLQEAGLRPTRSKRFGEGAGVSEHVAFQVVLEWLWGRHERAVGAGHSRPACVMRALAPCEQCALGEQCSVFDDIRGQCDGPLDGEGECSGSDWSDEGSSEDISSDGEKEPRPLAHGLCLSPALLVGDSNAVGYCETLHWDTSLRRALSCSFNVTVAAKSGAKWSNLAGDTQTTLSAYARQRRGKHESALAEGTYHRIIVVLGTNDIPTGRSREATWARLRGFITTVLANLPRYLHSDCEPANIIVTQPFCMEEGRAIDGFKDLLADLCGTSGCTFLPIAWISSSVGR